MENPLRISEEAKLYNLLRKDWVEKAKEMLNFKGKIDEKKILELIGEDRSLSIIAFYLVGLISSTKKGRRLLDENSKEYSKEELISS